MADSKDPTTEILLTHLEYLREGVDGINERLDAQNGRIRRAESDIAVLNDRGTRASALGTGGGFLGGLVAGFLQNWFSGK